MSELLVSRPGFLAVVNNIGVPGLVKFSIIGIPGGPLIATSAIITKISGSLQTNTRFTHALDNNIYTYSFGDRVSQATVSGLAFETDCSQAANGSVNPLSGGNLLTGLDQVLLFYGINRVSAFNFPVIIIAGTLSIMKGFLIGIDFATQSTELKTTAWTMKVAVTGSSVTGLL